MPIYEFRCNQCGQRLEKLCSIDQSSAKLPCPACSAAELYRVMSGFSSPGAGNQATGGASGCSTCSSGNCSTCGH